MKAVTKTKNEQSDDRKGVFAGLLRVVVVALVVGVLLTVFLASRANEGISDENSSEQAVSSSIEEQAKEQIEKAYGEKWRDLGITDWNYNPDASSIFYVESKEWQKLSDARHEEILRVLWRDIKDTERTNDQDRDQVFIMIHDEKRRMRAAYEAETGMIPY